ACPIVPKEPLNPPSPSTPQPKPLSPAELSGAKFLLATLTADKQAAQDKQQQYYQNILQIAGQNMCDAAAKQLARDEALMQQAYAVGDPYYMPLKRVEPGGQAKSLKDVWQNSLSGLINPTYGGNLPLAAWSTVGDLIDCGMQQVAHQISTVEGGSQTLAVVGYIPNKLIATVKDFSKDVAKKYLPKEYYQNLSEFYHGLPNNTKVTLNLFTDGLILHGAGSALKIGLTSPVPAAIQHIPHKPGISTTPSAMLAFEGGSSNPLLAIKGTTSGIGEISAISEVSKIPVDTGAVLEKNVLTKLEKPTTSSVVPKVEYKLPTSEVGEVKLGTSNVASDLSLKKHIETVTGIKKPVDLKFEQYTTYLKQYENWQQLPDLIKKVPKELGVAVCNNKMDGLKWKKGGDSIRIDKGNPNAEYIAQQIDHVAISHNGKVVDHTGNNYIMYDSKTNSMYKIRREDFEKGYNQDQSYWFEIDCNPSSKETSKHPDSHIPAEQWVKWKSFYKPD
ncbi:MAG: hypothetical protein LN563_01155, partial [Rickettsia endosymbiont of Platyusa sonomae]|nr:hypothetical protein [Rickettsia endosymbiont of Platyusa sonomae]